MPATRRPAAQTPKFKHPPVIELALGVQFNPLLPLNSILITAWREGIKAEFPTVQEHPELPETIEGPDLGAPTVRMQIMEGVLPRRYWFVNTADTELIQVQRNRFVYNWRKRKSTDEYPTYDVLREKVEKQLSKFLWFAAAENLGDFVPDLCEVTYINHIFGSGIWTRHGEAAKIFSSLSRRQTGTFLPAAESIMLASSYQIPAGGAGKLGRLRVQAEPSLSVADMTPLFRMTMSARVPAGTPDLKGVLSAMDTGHMWATCGFAALTTEQMHKAWGRER